jgi:cyclohexyl-isocyanide hydratase
MAIQIGLLVFPCVQQLDVTAPYEVFAYLPDTKMHLVWKTLEPVSSITGLVLAPTITSTDCPQLDLLCVPGGAGGPQVAARIPAIFGSPELFNS